MRGVTSSTAFNEVKRYLVSFHSVYTSRIYTSEFLSLLVDTRLVHFLDNYILSQLGATRDAETHTGYGDMVPIESGLNMIDMTQILKDIGQSLIVRANIHRHLLISKAVIVYTTKMLDTASLENLPAGSQTQRAKKKSRYWTWYQRWIHKSSGMSHILRAALKELKAKLQWHATLDQNDTLLLDKTSSKVYSCDDVAQSKIIARAAKEHSSTTRDLARITKNRRYFLQENHRYHANIISAQNFLRRPFRLAFVEL